MRKKIILPTTIIIIILGCFAAFLLSKRYFEQINRVEGFALEAVPAYTGAPSVIINDNIPYFAPKDLVKESYEQYGKLDVLGRCSTAMACIGSELMSTEPRGEIGHIKPTGWHTVKYDCIEDLYLYNRCHLIAYELTAENDNALNLITGTRYMNVEGMLPYENMVASYIRKTCNHVMYRITPIWKSDELVCRGVLMEAYSVEDNGAGIKFCVFCYNVQPGVLIDYATGNSHLSAD